MKMLLTNTFKKAVRQLRKSNNKRVLDDLAKSIELINNEAVESHMDNHPLKNANGLHDIHLAGGDLILLYKYVRDDLIEVSAKLHNVVNHDDLKKKGVFDERPAAEYDYNEVIKLIRGSTELDTDDIEDWVHEFYNDVIAQELLLDDIYIEYIRDLTSFAEISLVGTQWRDILPIEGLTSIKNKLRKIVCEHTSPFFEMYYFDSSNTYTDAEDFEAYDVKLVFRVPVEVVED